MTSPRTRFYLDKQNAKWAGVCAGIADYTGIDPTLVRLGFVGSLFLMGPLIFLIYFIAAWMAPRKPRELYDVSVEDQRFWQGVRANPKRTARDVRARFRALDRRLADMEAYVTSSNHRLAREIEELR
jgi:phage shock protein C